MWDIGLGVYLGLENVRELFRTHRAPPKGIMRVCSRIFLKQGCIARCLVYVNTPYRHCEGNVLCCTGMVQLPALLEYKEILHGISNRANGNMSLKYGPTDEVVKNRTAFFSQLGLTLDDGVMMSVLNADVIEDAKAEHRGLGMRDRQGAMEADALITNTPGVFLALLTADCLPMILYDPVKQIVALAHVGWQSSEAKLARRVVEALRENWGSHPSDLIVAAGPGIQAESYQKEKPKVAGIIGWKPFLKTQPDGLMSIDLIGYNRDQLAKAGVLPQHITFHPIDTAASPEFFSHYRAKRNGETEGRFLTVVGLALNRSEASGSGLRP